MNIKKTLLLIQYVLEDFLNHYDAGMEPWFHPGRYLYNSFADTTDRQAVRRTLAGLSRQGLLAKRRTEDYYRLTAAGWRALSSVAPAWRADRGRWDGLWRIVVYDIPEKKHSERNLFRRRLKELGFRLWQKSTWLSPYEVGRDLRKLLDQSSFPGRISVFESRSLFGIDDRDLAAKVWGLEKTNANYREMTARWRAAKKSARGDLPKLRRLARQWQFDFLTMMQKDRRLPEELLPSGWLGGQLRTTFSEVRKVIAQENEI